MSLRFEAWTLPWSGTFERVIADIPAIDGRGSIRFNDFGEGQISVPDDYARLDEIISSTVGTLIRVYDGTTIIQEFLAERVQRDIDDTGVARISGAGLEGVFDRTIVYPYDYPTNTFLDHIWGGANQLQNAGFEDSQLQPSIWEVTTDATGGTFTLTDGTNTTSAQAYNVGAGTLEAAIESAGIVDDCLVTLIDNGGDDHGWRIETVAEVENNLAIGTDSLTGETYLDVVRLQTGALQPSGWTRSQEVSEGTPREFGFYDNFRVVGPSTDVSGQQHSGSFSLWINPDTVTSDYHSRYAGAQQLVTVNPGGTYQASIWAYSITGGDYRFVIREIDEDLIAYTNVTLSAATWTQVTLTDVVIPDGVTQVIFRFANIESNVTPSDFYLDDAEFNEGQADATVGTIVASLMDDAASDHSGDTRGTILDWVDYTGFDGTNDSSAVAWDDSLSFTAYRGMTYGQVFDRLVELGYEWKLTPKASPGATTHDLDWYNAGGAGTDLTTSTTDPAIIGGTNTTGGPVVSRIPAYTAVLVEGEGVFVEDSDATALSNFGRFEKYHSDQALASSTSATAAGDALLALESSNRTAVKVSLVRTDNHPVPGVDYVVGDELYFQLPPALEKTARQVKQIVWSHGDETTYEVTGSRVFEGESGGWEALRLLLRKFARRQDRPANTAPSLGGGGGGMAHVLIVSDSEPVEIQNKADFIVPSTNSSAILQGVFDTIEAKQGNNGSWSIWLAGIFELDSDVTAPDGAWLRGLGYTETVAAE